MNPIMLVKRGDKSGMKILSYSCLFYGKENEEYSPAVRGYESKDGLER